MVNVISWLIEKVKKPYYEPEHDEVVEHDVVMTMIDGKLTEVTTDDSEVQQ